MVVRMHGLAEAAGGERGDDLVRIHVRAGARARLEIVDGEVLIVTARDNLGRGRIDGLGDLRIQQLESGVGSRRRLLHQAQRRDEGPRQRAPADWEILYRALSLRAPKGLRWHLQLAHAVALDSKGIRHEGTPPARCVIMQIVALRGFL
jgi:hypothetical protein